jgi:CRP/FNR family cyclic AMP-dependent transcriptional regulator
VSFWRKHRGSVDYLASVGFFEDFTPEELERVAALGTEQEIAAGSMLMDQGDVGQECFVIVEGTASVYVRDEYAASLHAGSIVGEMALVDHRPRRATVIADTELKVLRFDVRHFRRLLDELPRARSGVLALLEARMQR